MRLTQGVDPAVEAVAFGADQAGIAQCGGEQGDSLIGGDQGHREFLGVLPAHRPELHCSPVDEPGQYGPGLNRRWLILAVIGAAQLMVVLDAPITFTDQRERGKALGIFTAIAGGGGAIGLILGGVLTEYLSWRWCLYVNVVFAAAALAGAIPLIRNQPRNPGATLDVPGSLLAASGLVGIVYGFSQAAADGWASASTVGPIVAGVVLLGAFTVVEQCTATSSRSRSWPSCSRPAPWSPPCSTRGACGHEVLSAASRGSPG